MKPTNFLFILSDQHNRSVLGCYGNTAVKTPNLDRLADRGVVFTNAYTNSPICVPARASLATGKYVHQIRYWDNGIPYDGFVTSWAHRLRESGTRVDAIGKLHFRSSEDDNGFSREIDTMHTHEGIGDILGCMRENPLKRKKRGRITEAGPGDSTYIRYDARNAEGACSWLRHHSQDDKPWFLYIGFVLPHHPYTSPPPYYDMYDVDSVPLPPLWKRDKWPKHPAVDYLRSFFDFTDPFDENTVRKLNAAYYGSCSYLDSQIGRVLDALHETGLVQSTRIIYASDHGDSIGNRGLFGKCNMYDDAVSIPFLLAGPDIPRGKTIDVPISLVDCYPTILESFDVRMTADEKRNPGDSLWKVMGETQNKRYVFSEYHAVGSSSGIFMLRNRDYKYIHHINSPPQLFNMRSDPEESYDLSRSAESQSVLDSFEQQLRTIIDPQHVDKQAKADQRARVRRFGGRQAALRRGSFGATPVPGEEPRQKA